MTVVYGYHETFGQYVDTVYNQLNNTDPNDIYILPNDISWWLVPGTFTVE